MRTFALTIIIFLSTNLYGQNTISGFVQDADTGEKLIGAVVNEITTNNSVITNEYGFFSLDVSRKAKIAVSYVGYKKIIKQTDIKKDTLINFDIITDNNIGEVTVTSNRNGITDTEISTINIDIKQLQKMPTLGGETDIIRAIQILPGIQSGNEGTTGLYVRGGGADQNLFLLDGVTLYNISHLFGFMSVFNDDAINSMKVIKGGFPARYGGRLSSIIDIRMKEGNMKKLAGNFSVGLISSKFMLEAPIKKNKASFLISARRTYIDAIKGAINSFMTREGTDNSTNYYFYDITAKVNYKFSDKNRIYLSAYLGNDEFYNKNVVNDSSFNNENLNSINWGSKLINLRYNYSFSKNTFLNTGVYYSQYHLNNNSSSIYSNKIDASENSSYILQYASNISDFGAFSNLDIYLSKNYYIKVGGNAILHNFLPGVKALNISNRNESVKDTTSSGVNIYANEYRIYVENNLIISSFFKANFGLNTSLFNVQGKFYNSIEPRIATTFIISKNSSIKASYTQTKQYLHLLTNSGLGLPTDLWVPPTSKISPQKAVQYVCGYYQKLPYSITLSIETYYKKMQDMIAYKQNSSYFIESKNWDTKVLKNGNGRSYGGELFFRKNTKKLQIWLGYTFSRTYRQFDELNNGKEYSYKYDRTHDIALSIIYNLNKNISISANWVYGTGNAVTLPTSVYPSVLYPPVGDENFGEDESSFVLPIMMYRDKTELFDYGDRNSQRLPAYHRLDVSISMKKQKKHGERTFTLGLYNAYNRTNPYYLTFAYSSNNFSDYDARGEFRIVSLFPILPAVSYSFKF